MMNPEEGEKATDKNLGSNSSSKINDWLPMLSDTN